jgi:hypothetical protein
LETKNKINIETITGNIKLKIINSNTQLNISMNESDYQKYIISNYFNDYNKIEINFNPFIWSGYFDLISIQKFVNISCVDNCFLFVSNFNHLNGLIGVNGNVDYNFINVTSLGFLFFNVSY